MVPASTHLHLGISCAGCVFWCSVTFWWILFLLISLTFFQPLPTLRQHNHLQQWFPQQTTCAIQFLTQFMRKLFTQDGYGGTKPLEQRQSERSPNSQAIYEIMYSITQCHHPSNGANLWQWTPLKTLAQAALGGFFLEQQQQKKIE